MKKSHETKWQDDKTKLHAYEAAHSCAQDKKSTGMCAGAIACKLGLSYDI